MRVLADTNIWLRIADENCAQHATAKRSLEELLAGGAVIFITSQNVIEFWAVATRPTEANGFGWTSETTAAHLQRLRNEFVCLPESPEILTVWWDLVSALRICGKKVHDARLAAQAKAHHLTHILTFNQQDFAHFSGLETLVPRAKASEKSS